MTVFSPEPKSFYKVCGIGLANLDMSKELWNLLSLSSRCLWGYENVQDISKLAYDFDVSLRAAAEATLKQSLGKRKVEYYMTLESPWYFYNALVTAGHNHLHLAEWHKGGLQGLVKARCYSWETRKLTQDEAVFVKMHSKNYGG